LDRIVQGARYGLYFLTKVGNVLGNYWSDRTLDIINTISTSKYISQLHVDAQYQHMNYRYSELFLSHRINFIF
jgi:hypothetical protein